MVAMTKACLPLLKQCPGSRVVNMVSAAGLVQGQPCMAAYCASKHACGELSMRSVQSDDCGAGPSIR